MEDINYLEIILQGYFNHREYLSNYFRRECKKAEKKYYPADEFYSGCLHVIKSFEAEIFHKYCEWKDRLLRFAKKEIDTGKGDSQEIKERYNQKIAAINKDDLSVELKYGGSLQYKSIKYIKTAILEAQNNSEPQAEQQKDDLTNTPERNQSIDKFPEIFTEGGYQIFKLLNDKYQKDNNSLRAKYSYIFHFLNYEGYLCCNQSEFINFLVSENYIDKMSKIQPQNAKYEDIIQPLLHRYIKGFN